MTQLANGVETHKNHSTAWKCPACVSEPTVPQQWRWCQLSQLCPAEVVGQQGPSPTPARGTDLLYRPAALRSRAQEVVAGSRAEQERCGGGMKRLSRRGGSQGARGSSWGRQLTRSPACAWGPWSAAAAAPLARSTAGSSPWEMGGKAGSTRVLLPLH